MSGDLHALLIGVGHYFPNELPEGGGSYPSLDGAGRDIQRVEDFLTQSLRLPAERIRRLSVVAAREGTPREPREIWPTYRNMVKAFQDLAAEASPGDDVYIHYSGHGGRTPTLVPEEKGENGWDESLVPCDIGNPSAQYLRDIELARLVQDLVDKGLRLTIVLDCCHSGGALRGKDAVKRGGTFVDRTPRPVESLVASRADLAETWRRLKTNTSVGTKRNLSVHNWLPDPKGYVLFAACRPMESAVEYPFDDGEPQGALTYWLLDTLRRTGPGVSCKQLQDRLMAKIHTQFWYQTPMLMGEGARAFLGEGGAASQFAVNVLSAQGGRVLLNVGQSQGVSKGSQFLLQVPESNGQVRRKPLIAEIEELGATESWARIINLMRESPGRIEDARAILLQPGRILLQSAVRLVRHDGLPSGMNQDAALEAVRTALGRQDGFVHLATEGESVNFQVAVNADGEYEIWDPAGQAVPHLQPPLPIHESGAAPALVRRLVHLTRFRNVQAIENFDEQSPLVGKLHLEVVGVQSDYTPGDRPNPQPLQSTGGGVDLAYGEWLFVKIVNRSSRGLNVVVLDLQPDWGIAQVFPGKNDTPFWPLDPGEERLLRIRGTLPDGYCEGADILKAMGTLGAPDFRWLELPPLDHPPPVIVKRGDSADPLQQLFASLGARPPAKRHLNPSAFASEEWGTAQLEVRVRR